MTVGGGDGPRVGVTVLVRVFSARIGDACVQRVATSVFGHHFHARGMFSAMCCCFFSIFDRGLVPWVMK